MMTMINMLSVKKIIELIVMLILVVQSIEDIKTKKIHLAGTILIAIVSLVGNIYIGNFKENVLFTLMVTVLLLPVMFICKKSIGLGDMLTFIALTLTTGSRIMEVALISTITMSLVSLVLVILKKANKTTHLPFVPCILIGYIIKVVLV